VEDHTGRRESCQLLIKITGMWGVCPDGPRGRLPKEEEDIYLYIGT